MRGKCKLCQEIKDLQDSHYLPKGIYKILRDDDGCGNPNPWKLTKGIEVQTSKQQTAYLLCRECEQRFNNNGEAWVLKHCLRKGEFRLASFLAARKPDVSSEYTPTKVYYAANIPQINVSALAYFAASMFWRGAVYPWKEDGSSPVELGPYRERFREYLMHLRPFPQHCSLSLTVREGEETNCLTSTPTSRRLDNYHVHTFPMPGIAFMLAVGKDIPVFHLPLCFVHGSGNPIMVSPLLEPILENNLRKMLNGIPSQKKI